MQRANERLYYALTRARAANLVEFELPALIAIAKLELDRASIEEAQARLDQVWDGVERGPYLIYQADAYNTLANIARSEGDTARQIDAAQRAYKAAWCDGPPFAYHWGIEQAMRQLSACNAPTPDMPSFDDSDLKPLPNFDIRIIANANVKT
jgi:hypothetical protein